MQSIVHSEDELTDFSEAPYATEYGSTWVPYGISQHRTILEEEGKKDGVAKLITQLENEIQRSYDDSCFYCRIVQR